MFQLEAQLSDRNITIELTPEANQWLAERGYDDKFGARPLSRVIQEHIKKPLAEEILFGALKDGGIVRVLVEEKAGEKVLGFEYFKPDAPIRPRDPEDTDPEGEGPDDGGLKVAAKDRAPQAARQAGTAQARGGRQRTSGAEPRAESPARLEVALSRADRRVARHLVTARSHSWMPGSRPGRTSLVWVD